MLGTEHLALWTRIMPTWELIEPLRLFVESFARAQLGEDVANMAATAASELLENATKYSSLQQPIEFVVQHLEREAVIVIRVTNRSQLARIRILEREFAKAARGTGNALEVAVARASRMPEGTSMLGLARLAGQGDVTLEVKGDSVTMTARFSRHSLPGGGSLQQLRAR